MFRTLLSFTIELWYNVSRLKNSTYGSWLINKGNDNTNNEYLLGFSSSGQLQFTSTHTGTATATGGTTLNTWNHVAVVVDETNKRVIMYVNGVVSGVSTFTGTNSASTSSPLFIGARNYLGQNIGVENVTGILDEVRIWNTARSAAEISDGYLHVLSGNEANLVSYWNFNESAGNIVVDRSPNDHNGTFLNDVVRVTQNAPVN